MCKNPMPRIIRFLLLITIVVAPLTIARAQTSDGAANITEFDVNGMKVLIKRRPGTPTVAAGLFFRGGVANAKSATSGIENFTLSVATEGSKSYPQQKLRAETSRVGTVIGSGSTYDYSALSLACTKGSFDDSWQMFVDVAINPLFERGSIERVREGLLTSLRSESDSPEGELEALKSKVVFAGHPYALEPQGTIENVTKFKQADLIAYHRDLMQTSRLLLVVVGDVEPKALRERIARSFGNLPKGAYKSSKPPALAFDKASVDIASRPVQTNYVQGIFAAPSIGDADYYAMRTAVTVLQSQVFQEVRVKRNLSYAPNAELDEHSANTASISVSSVYPNDAVKVMLDEIENLKRGSVDEETISRIAAFFLTTYYLKQETNAAQIAALAQYELIGGGWRNSLLFLDRIRKVKPSEVQAAAKKYMTNIRFVVVGDPEAINRSIFLQTQENKSGPQNILQARIAP